MPVHPYLLFHSLVEIGAATVCFGTFLFAWNTRRFQNGFFQVLGTATLFVGLFGVLHCLAFPGMPVFAGYDENLSPQLWIAARVVLVSGMLGGLVLIDRPLHPGRLLLAWTCGFALLAGLIFAGAAPRMTQGRGLTPVKVALECVIAGCFLAAVALLGRARARFHPRVHRLLVATALTMAATDVCFTLYTRPHDAVNLAGHLLLLLGVGLQYQAILRVGLLDPNEAHFRQLKQAELELGRARERLERAQAAGRVSTFEWDSATDEASFTGIEAILGLSGAGAVTRSTWRERIHPDDLREVNARFAEALAGCAPLDLEYRVVWPDGAVRWLQARGRLERATDDRGQRLLGVVVDITRHKQAEQALMEADHRKSEFLAVLSHELRNPLAGIRNGLGVLERAPERSPSAARAQAVIGRQAAQLSRLVEDLLDLTRIAQGKIRLQRAPLDLAELARRVAEDHAPEMLAAGLRFEVDPGDAPLWVDGDPSRIAQILGNLLGNAAKFTPPGGLVRLAVAPAPGEVVLRVTDTGVGLAPDLLPRLFSPFMQAEQTLDHSRGGLGLGLALVRSLTELHGGTVAASSPGPGQGAAFEVRLPRLAVPARPSPGHEPRPAPRAGAPAVRQRVLIIEDNPDAGETLRDLLALMGHEAQLERTGAAGLEAAARLRPDLILCDVGLPDLDGYQVARRIRAAPALAGCLLVALTGYAGAEDVRRATEAGFDRHLPKPLAPEDLAAALASAAGGRVTGAASDPVDR